MHEQELLRIQGVPTNIFLPISSKPRHILLFFCVPISEIVPNSLSRQQNLIFQLEHHVVVVSTVAKLLFELKFVRRPQRKFGPSFPTTFLLKGKQNWLWLLILFIPTLKRNRAKRDILLFIFESFAPYFFLNQPNTSLFK